MSRIQIPLDVLTSRINLADRLESFRSGSLSTRFQSLKPISEFFDIKRFSKPANFGEAQSRVNYNLSYFSSNYAAVFAMLSIYALLTNRALLFDIVFIVVSMFLIGRLQGRDLEIGTFRATTSQLYTGVLIIAVPVGLFSSPISTILWLVGASGVGGGLGGRPRAPKVAPPWGRPSRRGRRRTDGDAASYDFWGGNVRVAELDSDEDTDTQGVGLATGRDRRFISDSLQFTGTDIGDRTTGVSRRQPYDDETDEEEQSSSSEDLDYDEDEMAQLTLRDKEEVLVRAAMARIERAQAMGRADVKLNKEELAALERRRKRMKENEAASKKKRGSGSSSDRKKRKEQRIAVPLTHLEPVSRKKKSSRVPKESLSRNVSATDLVEARQGLPPSGYFPPPASSRSRPRSGTSASAHHPSHTHQARGSSPFDYEYIQRPSSSASRRGGGLDPFQFQTAGPRAQYSSSPSAISRRNVSSPDKIYTSQYNVIAPATSRSRNHKSRQPSSEETSDAESSEESTSDDLGNGAQISQGHRSGRAAVIVEVSPEREHSSSKKKSSEAKRKPAASEKGGRRRKK